MMESLWLIFIASLVLVSKCVSKELVESFFQAGGDCSCPSAEWDCSLYCVDQAQCGHTLLADGKYMTSEYRNTNYMYRSFGLVADDIVLDRSIYTVNFMSR